MNKLISYSLLVGALLIGFSPSVLAFPDFKDAQADAIGEEAAAQQVIDSRAPAPEKFGLLRDRLGELAYKKSQAESVVNWLIDGIGRAVSASPPQFIDGMPPDMENADIPEFLVRQCLNASALQKAGTQVYGAKPNEIVLFLSVKVTPEEYRKLGARTTLENFIISNPDRWFIRIEKQ